MRKGNRGKLKPAKAVQKPMAYQKAIVSKHQLSAGAVAMMNMKADEVIPPSDLTASGRQTMRHRSLVLAAMCNISAEEFSQREKIK